MTRIYQATQRALGPEPVLVQGVPSPSGIGSARVVDIVSSGRGLVTGRAVDGFQRLALNVRTSWPNNSLVSFGLTSKVLLVAGAVHGDGVSTNARNLAVSLAKTGTGPVALVDANLRSPSQHVVLGLDREGGLTDVVDGRVPLGDALHAAVWPGVSLLTCGAPSDDPGAVLASTATREVLAQLGARFEWVVVDAPPLTVYSDAVLLARVTDAALLIVRAEATRYEVVEDAKRALIDAGSLVLGAVLNRCQHHIPDWIYRRLR